MVSRRTLLRSSAMVATTAAAASALPAGTRPAMADSRSANSITATVETPSVVRDPHGSTEPSGTQVRAIDGTNVLFAYGKVVPEISGWDRARQSPQRRYLSLDRTWRFRYDPDNVGQTDSWFAPDADDSGWDAITVPSCWDLLDNDGWPCYDAADFGKGGSLRDGYAWYRLSVAIPQSWQGSHVRLVSLGACYSADVWVDGEHVGKHEGGNTPFSLPLKGMGGRNVTIAIRVFRRASYTAYDGTGTAIGDDLALPPTPVDYWPYAGLTRSIWLESVPGVTIAKVLVDTPTLDGFDARVIVENHTDKAFSGKVLIDPGATSGAAPRTVAVSVPAGGVAVPSVRIAIPRAPRWSTAHPNLLTAKATLLGRSPDSLSTSYGVRTIEVGKAQLLLNGTPIFLAGTNWHEETARSGRSMTRAELDVELGNVHAIHANFVRNCVYQRHPYAYDWTDRHGTLVMDEWDTMWVNTAQQKLQLSYGLSKALALTTAWHQHNHPSVALWGLQNECTVENVTYRAWLADMKAAVKSVDLAGRPVTWASASSWDPVFDIADVVGFNEYFGYFYGKNEDLGTTLDKVHETYPDKPILITENGSWAWPLGNHGDPTEAGTEEWQAGNFQSHWDQIKARPYVTGYAFWVLKDYKQRRNYNMSLNGMSGMGMIAWDGRYHRLVYDKIQAAMGR